MIDDVPEIAGVYVITPVGEKPDEDELSKAAKLTYLRGFKAKEMCPSLGSCAMQVEHNRLEADGAAFDVDEYKLVCDAGCPFLVEGVSSSDNA